MHPSRGHPTRLSFTTWLVFSALSKEHACFVSFALFFSLSISSSRAWFWCHWQSGLCPIWRMLYYRHIGKCIVEYRFLLNTRRVRAGCVFGENMTCQMSRFFLLCPPTSTNIYARTPLFPLCSIPCFVLADLHFFFSFFFCTF